jgi:hypothetical protein
MYKQKIKEKDYTGFVVNLLCLQGLLSRSLLYTFLIENIKKQEFIQESNHIKKEKIARRTTGAKGCNF